MAVKHDTLLLLNTLLEFYAAASVLVFPRNFAGGNLSEAEVAKSWTGGNAVVAFGTRVMPAAMISLALGSLSEYLHNQGKDQKKKRYSRALTLMLASYHLQCTRLALIGGMDFNRDLKIGSLVGHGFLGVSFLRALLTMKDDGEE